MGVKDHCIRFTPVGYPYYGKSTKKYESSVSVKNEADGLAGRSSTQELGLNFSRNPGITVRARTRKNLCLNLWRKIPISQPLRKIEA